jgi:hypothetical protein
VGLVFPRADRSIAVEFPGYPVVRLRPIDGSSSCAGRWERAARLTYAGRSAGRWRRIQGRDGGRLGGALAVGRLLIRFYHEIAGVGLVFPRADRSIAVEFPGYPVVRLRPIEGLEFVEETVGCADYELGRFGRPAFSDWNSPNPGVQPPPCEGCAVSDDGARLTAFYRL